MDEEIALAPEIRVTPKFDFMSLSLVTHYYHGPWSYEGGICHGCGVGFIEIKGEPVEHLDNGNADQR